MQQALRLDATALLTFEQPRVFNRHHRLVGKRGDRLEIGGGKIPRLGVGDAEKSQYLPAYDQRHPHPGIAHIGSRLPVRIARRVGHKLRLAGFHQAFQIGVMRDGHTAFFERYAVHRWLESNGSPDAQEARLGHNQHRSAIIIDQFFEFFKLQLERFGGVLGGQDIRHLAQHFRLAALPALQGVQPRIVDGHGQLPGDAFEQSGAKRVKRMRRDVPQDQQAHDLGARNQRHDRPGAHAEGLKMPVIECILARIFDEDRFAGAQHPVHQAIVALASKRETGREIIGYPFLTHEATRQLKLLRGLVFQHVHNGGIHPRHAQHLLHSPGDHLVQVQRRGDVSTDRAQRQQLPAALFQVKAHAQGGDIMHHDQTRLGDVAHAFQGLDADLKRILGPSTGDNTLHRVLATRQQAHHGWIQGRTAQKFADMVGRQGRTGGIVDPADELQIVPDDLLAGIDHGQPITGSLERCTDDRAQSHITRQTDNQYGDQCDRRYIPQGGNDDHPFGTGEWRHHRDQHAEHRDRHHRQRATPQRHLPVRQRDHHHDPIDALAPQKDEGVLRPEKPEAPQHPVHPAMRVNLVHNRVLQGNAQPQDAGSDQPGHSQRHQNNLPPVGVHPVVKAEAQQRQRQQDDIRPRRGQHHDHGRDFGHLAF